MDPNPQPTDIRSPEETQAEDRAKLERARAGGASWFYWIAALSFVNSALLIFGGGWGFIVGLGATQFIDAVAMAVADELGSGAGGVAKTVALFGDALIAGVFVLFGVFAARGSNAAFALGMLIYALDGMLFLLVSDWLSLGFHGFALFCIWAGFSANRKLGALFSVGAPGEPVRPDPITP